MERQNPDLSPAELLPILPGHSSPGRFERVLRAGKFAVTTELAPPDSADPAQVYERASVFDGYVDAINATDGSGAHCHMSSVAVCGLLTRAGYSPIMQISCRDKNRIAVQGDILGASAMGVANILCLTGDGVESGDHPQAKPVFDMDCMSLLQIGAANPFAPPYEFRADRLAKKVAAGAQFVQTQYCYDINLLKSYMQRVRDLGLDKKVYILIGVGPLASARTAEWIRSNVPGVHIPDAVIKRLVRLKV